MKNYSITSNYSLIHDAPKLAVNQNRLNFHLNSNDYFGVQATMLGFIEERLLECESIDGSANYSKELALLRQLRSEAIHLHKQRYVIKPPSPNN